MTKPAAEFIWCRDMRHAWDPYTVEDATVGSRRGYRQTVRCSRCGTTRSRLIDARGRLVGGASYRYPQGYLAEPGTGRMDEARRAWIRLENLIPMSGASSRSGLRMIR